MRKMNTISNLSGYVVDEQYIDAAFNKVLKRKNIKLFVPESEKDDLLLTIDEIVEPVRNILESAIHRKKICDDERDWTLCNDVWSVIQDHLDYYDEYNNEVHKQFRLQKPKDVFYLMPGVCDYLWPPPEATWEFRMFFETDIGRVNLIIVVNYEFESMGDDKYLCWEDPDKYIEFTIPYVHDSNNNSTHDGGQQQQLCQEILRLVDPNGVSTVTADELLEALKFV